MEFVDRVLRCVECNSDFAFTAGEQLFFQTKEFKNDPKRCKPCMAKRWGTTRKCRSETLAVCANCGTQTIVPFKPTKGIPVLCRACFQRNQDTVSSSGIGTSNGFSVHQLGSNTP